MREGKHKRISPGCYIGNTCCTAETSRPSFMLHWLGLMEIPFPSTVVLNLDLLQEWEVLKFKSQFWLTLNKYNAKLKAVT